MRGLERLGQHPGDRLPVKHHLVRKERLVVARAAGVAFAWHIVSREHVHHAGFGERRRDVDGGDERMGVRRAHRPGVQQVRKAERQVVGVERRAGDVRRRALS